MANAGPAAFTGAPPNPDRFTDWKAYASELAMFFARQAQVGQAVQPTAVQLVHAPTGGAGAARALQDGLMLYDPALGAAMISIGGVWKKFALVP